MDGGNDVGSERRWDQFAALLGDPKIFPEKGLRSSGAERNDHVWFQHGDLGFEPGPGTRQIRARSAFCANAVFPAVPI